MRLGQAIIFGSMAGLLTLAAPTLARNSGTNPHAAKAVEATSASSPCRAYQQAADGTWMQLSCQEMGSETTASAPVSKSAADEAQ